MNTRVRFTQSECIRVTGSWGRYAREGIEVGSTTIERIVQGRYEWRDMQYKKTAQNRVWDPGIT